MYNTIQFSVATITILLLANHPAANFTNHPANLGVNAVCTPSGQYAPNDDVNKCCAYDGIKECSDVYINGMPTGCRCCVYDGAPCGIGQYSDRRCCSGYCGFDSFDNKYICTYFGKKR